jgi:hypothetical protein
MEMCWYMLSRVGLTLPPDRVLTLYREVKIRSDNFENGRFRDGWDDICILCEFVFRWDQYERP